jgi:hypothetical protein
MVKGVEQQGLSMLHSARSQLIGQRTQLINAVSTAASPWQRTHRLCRSDHARLMLSDRNLVVGNLP